MWVSSQGPNTSSCIKPRLFLIFAVCTCQLVRYAGYNDKQNTGKSSGRKTVGKIDRNFHLGNMDHSVAKREYSSGKHLSMWILHHMLTVEENSSGFVTR